MHKVLPPGPQYGVEAIQTPKRKKKRQTIFNGFCGFVSFQMFLTRKTFYKKGKTFKKKKKEFKPSPKKRQEHLTIIL